MYVSTFFFLFSIVCSNDDLVFDLDLFYDKVKFCSLDFYIGKSDNDGLLGNYFSCDLEIN